MRPPAPGCPAKRETTWGQAACLLGNLNEVVARDALLGSASRNPFRVHRHYSSYPGLLIPRNPGLCAKIPLGFTKELSSLRRFIFIRARELFLHCKRLVCAAK